MSRDPRTASAGSPLVKHRAIRRLLGTPVARLLAAGGYEVVPRRPAYLSDLDEAHAETYARVAPFTMTTFERVAALCEAVRYVARYEIPGAIVECGVWKGGSMMAVAETLLQLGATDCELFLFDTFAGMPPPGAYDARFTGESAADILDAPDERERVLATASLEEVRKNVLGVGYDPRRVHFVQGLVEETIPQRAPEQIALLRLDTDWYESTRHELTHLYPRLSRGGVLIIDDYGCWLGARRATDEYIEEHGLRLLLNRIDSAARVAVKA